MGQQNKQNSRRVNLIIGLGALCIGLGVFYLSQNQHANSIQPYRADRDRAFVIEFAQRDHYWLSANPHFDPAYILDNATPQNDRQYAGKLITMVKLERGSPVGFVSYYPKDTEEGRVLFLLVSEEYRGKNYGAELLLHAVDALRAQGKKVITLAVRSNNLRAIRLYEKLDFSRDQRVGDFIYMKRLVP